MTARTHHVDHVRDKGGHGEHKASERVVAHAGGDGGLVALAVLVNVLEGRALDHNIRLRHVTPQCSTHPPTSAVPIMMKAVSEISFEHVMPVVSSDPSPLRDSLDADGSCAGE